MASYNRVVLIGNLTRDPELRVTPKGTAVSSLGLAVNRKYKDETGNPKEEVAFVELTAFGKTAELIGKYLGRGSACLVEGHLKYDQWEDKETHQKRSRLTVIVENVQFLGAPKSGGQQTHPDDANDEEAAEDLDPELAGASSRIPF